MAKKLSIIIPVYNVEQYVERCIRSIVTQAVPTDSYELIAVNDGSTDGSRDILVRLKTEYPFIRILDKENGGAASARNAGIRQATGEYFFFIDSDDWIAEDALPFLLKKIAEKPVDIIMFEVCEIYDNGKTIPLTSDLPRSRPGEILRVEDYLVDYTVRNSSCMNLFSRELFFGHRRIDLKENLMSEDDDFIVKVFSVAKQMVYCDKLIYFYYQRAGSASKNTDATHNERLIRDKLQILEELKDYIQQFQGKRKHGLERRLNFQAIDIIRWLIQKNIPVNLIDEVLTKLRSMGYYPIPKARYLWKYSLFRILFYYPFAVKWGRWLRNYI